MRSLAPAVCTSEGGRSGVAPSLRRRGASDESLQSAAPSLRPRRGAGAGAGLRALEGCCVGRRAAHLGAERGRVGGQGMAGTRASFCGTQVRDCAHRRAADSARAFRVLRGRVFACTTAEDSAGRRCGHEGTHSARRSNAATSEVSPRRDTCFCARANGGIQAAPREPDRALLRGHSVGGGRCAA